MTHAWATKSLSVLLAAAALVGFGSTVARAQSPGSVVYVSSSGNDVDDCFTPSTACRQLSSAHGKVLDGGTITCLDGGFFFNVTITKSVTIQCLGARNAAVVAINAPGKTVRLRGLALNALGELTRPTIDIQAAGSVHLENVLAYGNINVGILDRRTGPGKLFISDSSISGNSGPAIVVAPQGGTTVSAVLDNVKVRDSNYGIAVGNGGRVMIRRSVFSSSFTAGIEADPGAFVTIKDTLVGNNPTGILASGGSTVSLANSDIHANTTGISGPTRSHGDNSFLGNTSDGTAPIPVGSLSSENGLR
jgi:Right handed beta helix region